MRTWSYYVSTSAKPHSAAVCLSPSCQPRSAIVGYGDVESWLKVDKTALGHGKGQDTGPDECLKSPRTRTHLHLFLSFPRNTTFHAFLPALVLSLLPLVIASVVVSCADHRTRVIMSSCPGIHFIQISPTNILLSYSHFIIIALYSP